MCKLTDTIASGQVLILREKLSKHDALDKLIEAMSANPVVQDREAFKKAIFARESITSTGIGEGIAIPHVHIPEITETTRGVAIAPKGVDFDTLDNHPVHVIILFATPQDADKEYLGLLAQVMILIRQPKTFKALKAARSVKKVLEILAG